MKIFFQNPVLSILTCPVVISKGYRKDNEKISCNSALKKESFCFSSTNIENYCKSQKNVVPLRAILKRVVYISLILLAVCFFACRRPAVPRPYGYFRIAIPDTAYARYAPAHYPYSFQLSKNAVVKPKKQDGERYWIDIYYPTLNTTIHCSYKPVNNNLRTLASDAQEFLFNHATMASAIPEQEFANPDQKVYGVYYELHGNTASPIQFVLTDSIEHFFRGSVYCNDIPNQDSLAPIFEYMEHDVRRLMESMQWQK